MTSIVNEVNIQLPLVLTDDEAAQIADRLLYRAWIERESYEIRVPVKYAYLDAGDVLTFTYNNRAYRMRINTIDFSVPGILTIRGVAEDVAVYTSNAVGGSGVATTQNFGLTAATKLHLMDIPVLRDADVDDLLYYAAAAGYSSTWTAAVLYRSTDSGTTYQGIDSMLTAASIGTADGVLADGQEFTWDEANEVTVTMLNGTLSSDSDENVLAGANVALLGSEIIQWRTATLVAAGQYTLSGLLRGRRGTEWATDTHLTGDRFIVLTLAALVREIIPNTELNLSRLYKGVTAGLTVQETTSQSFTTAGVCLKPFAPVYVRAARDGANNITLEWNRRSRQTAQNFWTPTLAEDSELYEIDIYSDPSTVVATVSGVSAETYTYAAASQTSDGFTPGDAIKFGIFQISATVGRGYEGSDTV